MPFTRLVGRDDAGAIAEILDRNREFMAPTAPDRDESFYTIEGQARVIAGALTTTRPACGFPM